MSTIAKTVGMRRAEAGAMHSVRYALACASSAVWPAIVFMIPVGLTFTAARVYAEAGVAPPPACSSQEVATCADAAAQQACDCGNGNGDCACVSGRCLGNAGTVDTLTCKAILTCRQYELGPCTGKADGEPCTQTASNGGPGPSGSCIALTNGCLEKQEDGLYHSAHPLACNAPVDAGTPNASDRTAQPGSDLPAGKDGCNVAMGASDPSALFAAPLGLGLGILLTRRRRRPGVNTAKGVERSGVRRR
jgi:MYXO-CTERM domain-containing protein